MSIGKIPDLVLLVVFRLLVKILSMMVAEDSVTRVGLFIRGINESEYKMSKKSEVGL